MIDFEAVDPLVFLVYMEMRTQRMTQKVLAAQVGISQKHLSQIFHGKSRASLPMLRKLLDALDLEVVVQPKPKLPS